MNEIKRKEKIVVDFFKDAFCVDGEIKILVGKEKTKDLKLEAMIELNDSKRGKFCIGLFEKGE